jgi:sugar phosphate isomerase/epimerase
MFHILPDRSAAREIPVSLTLSMQVAMNHATVREQCDLEQFVGLCVRHGITQVALWRDKVVELGVGRAKRLLADAGLTVIGYNRIGPLLTNDAAERRARLDEANRVIEEAAELRSGCVFVFPGGLPAGSKDIRAARAQTFDLIAELLPLARAARVPLALEPLHPMLAADRSPLSTVREANDWCDRLGCGVGIVVDVYHVWWDATLQAEIQRAGRDRLLGFQVCDWLATTKHLTRDRGMMGDGVIDLHTLRAWMDAAGFVGPNDVEIFSDYWWSRPADEVFRIAVERAKETLLR